MSKDALEWWNANECRMDAGSAYCFTHKRLAVSCANLYLSTLQQVKQQAIEMSKDGCTDMQLALSLIVSLVDRVTQGKE